MLLIGYQERSRFQSDQHYCVAYGVLGRRGRESFHIISTPVEPVEG